MNLFFGRKKETQKHSTSNRAQVAQYVNSLVEQVNVLLDEAQTSTNIDLKKEKLSIAMKKVLDVLAIARKHSSIDTRKISATYIIIRDLRNEIKTMEATPLRVERRDVA